MTDIVWGTGYGAKRHIPDSDGIKTYNEGRRRYARAACSTIIHIDTFADDEKVRDFVMRKTPCTRCATKANVKPCSACNGAGVVQA